jgi:hypothetical protein
MKDTSIMPPNNERMEEIKQLFQKYTAPHIKIKIG